MQNSGEEAIAGKTSGLIGKDEEVTWKATHLGFTQTLSSRITRYLYPIYFQDEMINGIFKKMKHEHLFYEKDGITRMKDIFQFESPFGWAGKVAERFFLSGYLKNLLIQRNQVIKQVAENGDWKNILI
jgi:ligand-binding SRPBCC domain-containing protein